MKKLLRYKWLLALAIVGVSLAAGAEEVAHEAAHEAAEGGIPRTVLYQTVNFILFLVLMFWLLRKHIVNYFTTRRDEYLSAVKKFEHAKAEAERKTAELRVHLERLEATATASVEKAKKEADDMQAKIVSEAQQSSQKLQTEAKKTIEVEVSRAIQELREEVLRQATEAARQLMQQQLKEPDQKRLQNEFVEKIQEVRP